MSTVEAEFRDLARWSAGTSPLYERLCRVVADDPALRSLAERVPSDRHRANVFLAAVHFRLLRGDDHPLADYYPSVTADPRPVDDDLAATFRRFCLDRAETLAPLLESRRTQTNAVRRSVVLYPAMARVAATVDGPLAIVEVGASAGLNLLWDRYRYDYDGPLVGAKDAPVTIETDLRGSGDPPLPDRPPAVRSRVGVDLNPLDVTDPDDADWLRALTWPEDPDRRRVLDGAIAAAREDPPEVVRGDARERLPGLLADVPRDVPVVVVSTLVLYQLPDAARAELETLLADRATERPLHWLSGDDEHGDADGIRLEWTRGVDGEARTDLLGTFHQHGEWLDWCGTVD